LYRLVKGYRGEEDLRNTWKRSKRVGTNLQDIIEICVWVQYRLNTTYCQRGDRIYIISELCHGYMFRPFPRPSSGQYKTLCSFIIECKTKWDPTEYTSLYIMFCIGLKIAEKTGETCSHGVNLILYISYHHFDNKSCFRRYCTYTLYHYTTGWPVLKRKC
jgi:hypothetical protein